MDCSMLEGAIFGLPAPPLPLMLVGNYRNETSHVYQLKTQNYAEMATQSGQSGQSGLSGPNSDERINFYRVCRIILDHVPGVLRQVFKEKVQAHPVHRHTWDDTPTSGKWMWQQEEWKEKLVSEQKKLIKDGDTSQWDPTLIFHALLYSHLCLLAEEMSGATPTKANVIHIPNLPHGIRQGGKILVEIQFPVKTKTKTRCTIHEVHISQNNPDIRLKPPVGDFKRATSVRCFFCLPEWEAIDTLRLLRNHAFAHKNAMKTSDNDLTCLISEVESAYRILKRGRDVCEELGRIETEPIMDSEGWKLRQRLEEEERMIEAIKYRLDRVESEIPVLQEMSEGLLERMEVQEHHIEERDLQMKTLTSEVHAIKNEAEKRLQSLETKMDTTVQYGADQIEQIEQSMTELEQKLSQQQAIVPRGSVVVNYNIINPGTAGGSSGSLISNQPSMGSSSDPFSLLSTLATSLQHEALDPTNYRNTPMTSLAIGSTGSPTNPSPSHSSQQSSALALLPSPHIPTSSQQPNPSALTQSHLPHTTTQTPSPQTPSLQIPPPKIHFPLIRNPTPSNEVRLEQMLEAKPQYDFTEDGSSQSGHSRHKCTIKFSSSSGVTKITSGWHGHKQDAKDDATKKAICKLHEKKLVPKGALAQSTECSSGVRLELAELLRGRGVEDPDKKVKYETKELPGGGYQCTVFAPTLGRAKGDCCSSREEAKDSAAQKLIEKVKRL